MTNSDEVTHWAGIPIEHMNEDQLRRALKQAVRAHRGFVNSQAQMAEWRDKIRTHYGTAATVSERSGWIFRLYDKAFGRMAKE